MSQQQRQQWPRNINCIIYGALDQKIAMFRSDAINAIREFADFTLVDLESEAEEDEFEEVFRDDRS